MKPTFFLSKEYGTIKTSNSYLAGVTISGQHLSEDSYYPKAAIP